MRMPDRTEAERALWDISAAAVCAALVRRAGGDFKSGKAIKYQAYLAAQYADAIVEERALRFSEDKPAIRPA